jgi:glycerophosphoryl diester phosphodiesterase
MAAVYAALDLRVAMVEVDVHRSLDGELVVIHDATVDRTTDGSGLVRKLTLTELRQLDAGSWFRSRFSQERIPTLREVLEAVKDRAILLIELKAPETEIPTIQLVRELDMSQQVIVQSFDSAQIQSVKELAPDINTVLLVSRPNHGSEPIEAAQWMLNTVESVGASGVAVHYNWCTSQLIELASERGLDVYVWTVDRRSKLRKFIKAGVDGIITNRPQNLSTPS